MLDCVFDKGRECAALEKKKCKNCSFRKTERELMVGREKAKEMLSSLPKEKYQAIMKKYYSRTNAEVE